MEKIEERVRNIVTSFYCIAKILEKPGNKHTSDYLEKNSVHIAKIMQNSIKYLIDMSKIIDKNFQMDLILIN